MKYKRYFLLGSYLLAASSNLYAQNYYPNKVSFGVTGKDIFYRLAIDRTVIEFGIEGKKYILTSTHSLFLGTSIPTYLICKKLVCDFSENLHFTLPIAFSAGVDQNYIRLGASLMITDSYLYSRGVAFSLMVERQEFLSETELSGTGVSLSYHLDLSKL